ncbi:PhoH family protein [Gleimia sp. 6138-11-ORH1]|uniref:PhoH family protein n=1 Tax=Gleimia sp. 6138-11-ORH1 TaxID=2973937 RepID=UPI002168A582|nr:PhoH family protein [Gleimia sp. 6138-11-ORH1]MCS4484192.1 PhoH family protein [Gleimia sp. 6138-11-ORH1]
MSIEQTPEVELEYDRSVTTTVTIPQNLDPVTVLGASDQVLASLEKGFPGVSVHALGNEITISGSAANVATVADLVKELISLARSGQYLNSDTVEHAIGLLAQTGTAPALTESILNVRGRVIRAKTAGQQRYVEMIAENTIVFGIGPAGTGKTYLAMAMAVNALLTGQVRRIILTRPAVEAGESLGFLPGTLTEKIDPYLRPLYDALNDMVDAEALPRLLAAGTIEVAPLAYMRGRTLNDAFIILDEAQNTTQAQMKMFLTRLGFRSKVVVTGDSSQIDLPGNTKSGLQTAYDILQGIDGIEFCALSSADVVRHRLVGDIIDAYQRWDEQHPQPEYRASGRGSYRRKT